ncbi:SpvB/TcaC N-terminal domain-containing protein, partial [Flavobacterium sp.]|uniref:SpvB/TcaC N-terminal domain-containing protein n=1 Tax=Flavobacterium sp. TaxID=239 RepID=UPI003C39ED91
MKKQLATFLFLISFVVFATQFNIAKKITDAIFSKNANIEETIIVKNSPSAILKKIPVTAVPSNSYEADINQGIIGITKVDEQDDAYDNVFHITINQLPTANQQAYLEYELYGYSHSGSISRSINNLPSMGGGFISKKQAWTLQQELVSNTILRKGDNTLLFTAPLTVTEGYKVKNIKITYRQKTENEGYELLRFEDKLYIKGAISSSLTQSLRIDDKEIDVNQPEFEMECIIDVNHQTIRIEKVDKKGIKSQTTLHKSDFIAVQNYKTTLAIKAIKQQKITTSGGGNVSYNGLWATFPTEAVKKDISISVQGLRSKDIAALNTSMINVTHQNAGYRLLPHGTKFEKAVQIGIHYDKKLIPEGYTEKDINIFYFDEFKRQWKEVAKDSLIIAQGQLVAKTTHFTDFIAGIIKLPESPETSGYTPTSIKDLKAASPLVGMGSIAPPSANPNGAGTTSFGIQIPKGRSGMQPSLALQYSSDGSHSWAGWGWDVSIPSVNIETRWGTPRYDSNLETESYNIAGDGLLPNAHRSAWVSRTADKQFRPRKEGAFQKIIRKGNSPQNYYWVVTDKSGIISYYGGTPTGLAVNSVLQDVNGNIGHWALSMQVDLRGNTITYEYEKSSGELFIKTIYYTGKGADKGAYSVRFIKDADLGEATRKDVMINARLGFKQLNDKLLRKIEVRFKDEMVRSYELKYKEGAFNKTLLASVTELDSKGALFYTNTLDYYDDVRDASGKYTPFGPEENWNVPDDHLKVKIFNFPVGFNGFQPLVSSSSGSSTGFNYRVGVGIAKIGSFKTNTVGPHGSNSFGSSSTAVMLEDLDGDGLPDKVFKNDSGVFYRKNLSNVSNNMGFGDPIQIPGILNIGHVKSSSFAWGVDAILGAGSVGGNLGFDKLTGKSSVKSYFMDFNGDGLVDFVNNGQVYYNRLVNGVPTFQKSSSGTPSPVSSDGVVLINPSTKIDINELERKNPLEDIVRTWEAPVDGEIIVSQAFNLIEEVIPERIEARKNYLKNDGTDKADGVHLYFQKGTILIWDEKIAATNYNLITKPDQTFNVKKGDKLFFRVSAVYDGNFDKVNWNPKIHYTKVLHSERNPLTGEITSALNNISPLTKDVNSLSLTDYDATEDFLVSSKASILIPETTTIQFAGHFIKPITSDHVVLKLIKKKPEPDNSEIELYTQLFDAKEAVDFDLTSIPSYSVDAFTGVRIILETETNIDWKAIDFKPSVVYPVQSVLENKLLEVDHTLFRKREGNYVIPGKQSTVLATAPIEMYIDEDDYTLNTDTPNAEFDSKVILTAKQNNKLVAKKTYNLKNGVLEPTTTLNETGYVYDFVEKETPFQVEVTISNPKAITILRNYPKFNALKIKFRQEYTELDEDDKPILKYELFETDDFSIYSLVGNEGNPILNKQELELGLKYRNWGCFLIRNDGNSTINTAALFSSASYNDSEDNLPDTDSEPQESDPSSGLENTYFTSLFPVYSENRYYGLEKNMYISGKEMGTARLGEDDIVQYHDFSLPPLTIGGGTTTATDMITENKSTSYGGGASVGSISAGYTQSKNGESIVIETMSDFNGDRFPDRFQDQKLQITNPRGGLSNQVVQIGDFSKSITGSTGVDTGGSYSHGVAKLSAQLKASGTKDAKVLSAKIASAIESEKASKFVSFSPSGSAGFGDDHSEQAHIDINGDGIPDKVSDNGTVALGTGYGFLNTENWNFNTLNAGKSVDWSAGLGFSFKKASFTGGANYARSTSQTENAVMDINADGLADKIEYTDTEIKVSLNLGNGFAPQIIYPRYKAINKNSSISYGINAGGTIPIPLFFLRLAISIGGNSGESISRSEGTLMDMNGDGYLDYIESEDEDHLIVRLSTIGRTNKLKGATNAAGNHFAVDYTLIKPTYECPNPLWVLSETTVFDGHTGDGVDEMKSKFIYENPYYDRRERDFYGFEKVIQQQINTTDNSVYTTSIQEFYNRDYFRKNLAKLSKMLDTDGTTLLQESSSRYRWTNATTQADINENDLASPATDAVSVFIAPLQTTEKHFEGSDYLESSTINTFDATGNIIEYVDLGNGTPNDKVTAKISYYNSSTPYYDGIAKQIEVFTNEGLKRKRSTTINPTTAEVTQIKNYLSASEAAVTDIEYDEYGNLKKITAPENYKKQRATLDYTYDDQVHSYMTGIQDVFGYKNQMQYDYKYGIPVKTTDRNDQEMEYTLDNKGRVATIRGPYEIAAGKPYTIAYEYYPDAVVPYAKTRNYDPEHDKDIETYTYTDGLGRALQVKKTASLFTAAGSADQEAHIISGKVIYDAFGRAIESYYPTTTTTLNADFSTALSTVTPTKTEYDSRNRAYKVVYPDGSTHRTEFKIDQFNSVPTLLTTQTDALGVVSRSHTDVKGLSLSSIQNSAEGELVTKFDYNALSELLEVTNALGQITKSSYDLMGRRTQLIHPDAGTIETKYDLANNMTQRITADIRNTIPNGGAITYEYDYNRLQEIKYPRNTQNNVRYHYGKAEGTVARRGRLWLVEDASGGQEFFYGKLGEVEKEIRTLRITPTDIQTYVTQTQYDTWNRIQKMTYPDGEVLDYAYNRAGNLYAMQGKKESHTYDYIKQLGYDEFEQRNYLKYGNNTETTYNYDPQMRRLQQMKVNSGTRVVMNNAYNYDLMGNVLGIKNSAP